MTKPGDLEWGDVTRVRASHYWNGQWDDEWAEVVSNLRPWLPSIDPPSSSPQTPLTTNSSTESSVMRNVVRKFVAGEVVTEQRIGNYPGYFSERAANSKREGQGKDPIPVTDGYNWVKDYVKDGRISYNMWVVLPEEVDRSLFSPKVNEWGEVAP